MDVRRQLACLALVAATTGCTRYRALATTAVVTLAADWYQTQDITRNCLELNPIIGECGERTPPNVYFPASIALTLAVAALLPTAWGEVFLGAITGAEASTVWSNWANKELR